MRMSITRFSRLTNAVSKKSENHEHAVALHFSITISSASTDPKDHPRGSRGDHLQGPYYPEPISHDGSRRKEAGRADHQLPASGL